MLQNDGRRRCLIMRRQVHAFVLAAAITAMSRTAKAQVPEMPLGSRVLSSASTGDGIGSPLTDEILNPAVVLPVGASVNVLSSVSASPAIMANPAMIAAAQPSTPAGDPGCTEKVPQAFVRSGDLPEAPSAYVPLSSHCKFELFLRRAYSPYTFASAAFEAGLAQMSAQWPQYGGGMQGWGKRLGATLADTESRRFLQTYLFSTVLHQDPRYFPSTKKGVVGRAWYAATRVLVTKGDNGRDQFNASEFLGALSTSALQNAYYPQHYRTVDATMSRFTGALSSDATSAILREFTPDLKRLFDKHCPRKIQKFEAKLPIPEQDKP